MLIPHRGPTRKVEVYVDGQYAFTTAQFRLLRDARAYYAQRPQRITVASIPRRVVELTETSRVVCRFA